MPRDVNGTYTRWNTTYPSATPSGLWAYVKGGVKKIFAADHDSHDNDMASAHNDALLKDGRVAATANISMGNFKLTSVGDATSAQDALNRRSGYELPFGWCGNSTGTTPNFVLTPSIAFRAYYNGMRVVFKAHTTSAASGLKTLNVSGLGAVSCYTTSPDINNQNFKLTGNVIYEAIYADNTIMSNTGFYIREFLPLVQGWDNIFWTPTIGATSGGLTGTTVNFAKYRIEGQTVHIKGKFTTTPSATPIGLTCTLPTGYGTGTGDQTLACYINRVGTDVLGGVAIISGSTININRYDYAALGSGVQVAVGFAGSYML